MSSRFVLPLMMVAVLILLAVSGSARLIEGEKWTGGETTSGEHRPVIRFFKHMYMQQLPAGHSCGSNNRNNPCSP